MRRDHLGRCHSTVDRVGVCRRVSESHYLAAAGADDVVRVGRQSGRHCSGAAPRSNGRGGSRILGDDVLGQVDSCAAVVARTHLHTVVDTPCSCDRSHGCTTSSGCRNRDRGHHDERISHDGQSRARDHTLDVNVSTFEGFDLHTVSDDTSLGREACGSTN